MLVAGEPISQPVHPIGVLTDQLIPGRHGGLVPGGVEYGGALQLVRRLHPLVIADLLGMRHAGRTQGRDGRDIEILRICTAISWQVVTVGNAKLRFRIPNPGSAKEFHGNYRRVPAYGPYMSNLSFGLETIPLPALSREYRVKVTFVASGTPGVSGTAASVQLGARPAFEPGAPARRRRQLDIRCGHGRHPGHDDMPGQPAPAEANHSGRTPRGQYLKT